MTDNTDGRETGFRRLIREAKEEAFHSRRQLRREQPNPSSDAKRDAANAHADYQDVLADYADERALDVDWEERLPVDLDELLAETTTVERTVPSRNTGAAQSATVPAAAALSAQDLLKIGKELDAIAKELGFAASADSSTPQEEATMEDLQWLLKSRGQETALDQLPGGDDE